MAINFNKFKKVEGEELVKPTHMKKKSIQSLSAANIDNVNITAKDIINSLMLRFSGHKYQINNVYLFEGWESDFITFSEADYLYEIEIKVTRSDFWDDQKLKISKHQLLESLEIPTFKKKPNKFFYAVPKGLMPTHVIPSYAGYIEVSDPKLPANIIKDAPFLHKENLLDQNMKDILLKKFYNRYTDFYLKNYNTSAIS